VPDDVSVVGYDDSAFMNCTDPPLTTVRQPIEDMAAEMGRMLLQPDDEPRVVPLFAPELVLRSSA
jgi:DNA-binding LacI/PurR family transcriptional regulator